MYSNSLTFAKQSQQHLDFSLSLYEMPFSVQSMQHSFSNEDQNNHKIDKHYILYESEHRRDKFSEIGARILHFYINNLQEMIILTILLQKDKQAVKLVTMIKQKQGSVIRIKLEFATPNVLDIDKYIQKQQQWQKKLRQYFFLSKQLPQFDQQQQCFLKGKIEDYLIESLFGGQTIVMVNFGIFGQYVRDNMDPIITLLRNKDISEIYINKNLLLLQQKNYLQQNMQINSVKKQICADIEALIKVKRIVYLHFDKVYNYLLEKYSINANILLQQNRKILINNLNERNCKVKIIMNVKENIHLGYLIQFNSSNSLAKFLKVAYENYLWVGIEYMQSSSLPQLKDISILQFDKLAKCIQKYQVMREFKDGPNCQSYQCYVESAQQGLPLDKINEILKKQDLLALKQIWASGLMQKIEEICLNWQVYGHLYRQSLLTFTKVHLYKMHKMYLQLKDKKQNTQNKPYFLYQSIYPKITHYIQILLTKLGLNKKFNFLKRAIQMSIDKRLQEQFLQNIRKQQNIEEHIADKIFYYFMAEQQNKSLNFNIVLQKPMPMSEYIASCNHFSIKSQHWNHIFTSLHQIIHTQNQKKKLFFRQIQSERLVETRCLGCSTFFIQSQNIYDELVNGSPVRVLGSIQRLRESQVMLKDQICGLLNSGGGIIFFDCVKVYRQIRPVGVLMNQKDKQQYQQRIYSYINQFHPKLQVKSHILVNFVPVVDPQAQGDRSKYSGVDGILKANYYYSKRRMFCARFVTRIKVIPADPSFVYFWFVHSKEQQIRKYCLTLQNSNLIKINTRDMNRMIKKKMNRFYNQENILCYPSILITHECVEPQQGVSLPEIPKYEHKMKKTVIFQDHYNYLSLLISAHKNEQIIRRNLKKSRMNFDLQIIFKQKEFKPARNTFALYHNNKFEEIYRQVKKQQYKFDNRQVLVINVTSYLKLELKKQQQNSIRYLFDLIEQEFSKEYSEESLKLYQFKLSPMKNQYYFLTQTKTSNLFMYYLLNDMGQKAIFKNPYLLDKLTPQERQERMILKLEKKGRNDLLFQRHLPLINQSNENPTDDQVVKIPKPCELLLDDENWQSFWQQNFSQYNYRIDQVINLLK